MTILYVFVGVMSALSWLIIWMIAKSLSENTQDLAEEIDDLIKRIDKLERDVKNLKQFEDVFKEESAEWATGIDRFREEVLKSHPKIRNILDVDDKAVKAEEAANLRLIDGKSA